jgi:uncharacterized membrane protein
VARWTADGFTAGVASGRFWWGVLVGLMVYAPIAATLWLALTRRRQRGA